MILDTMILDTMILDTMILDTMILDTMILDTMILEDMREPDLDEVERIAASGFEHAWTRDAFASELAREVARCRVSRDAPGGPIRAYAVWWLVAGEQSLLTIATAPEARRRGHARALLEQMLEEARARGATECFLEVRPSNTAAITLYTALGFQRFDVRERYYPDGEDAWILRAELRSVVDAR